MSRREIRLQRENRDLKDALRPFARFTHERDAMKRVQDEVFVPTEGDVWLYVGTADPAAPAHLHTNDFIRAQELV